MVVVFSCRRRWEGFWLLSLWGGLSDVAVSLLSAGGICDVYHLRSGFLALISKVNSPWGRDQICCLIAATAEDAFLSRYCGVLFKLPHPSILLL